MVIINLWANSLFAHFFAVFCSCFLQMHRLSLQFVLLKLCFNRSSFLVINYDDRVDG